jgi:N-acetylated-alpha-linked acidic dipeptidase
MLFSATLSVVHAFPRMNVLVRFVPLAVLASATLLAAQQPALTGYSPAASQRQRAAEAEAIRRPAPERARAHSRVLSAEAHVAGTPGQARTRDYVIQQMRAMGLDTEVRTYNVYLPHATSARVWRVSPAARELPTAEPPIPGDGTSAGAQYPAANGYSAAGDVQGQVVYVNFGLMEDYARLDSMGVSVRGKIAVARYGRSFRGIKAREAERNGALALILYSDPQQDGPGTGAAYPGGPMRPGTAIQRGSIFNGNGDPTTPGVPSVRGARRTAPTYGSPQPRDTATRSRDPRRQDRRRPSQERDERAPPIVLPIPSIPVVAIGYDNAAELLRGLSGREVPEGWQGGLPFRYRVGAGPTVARVAVETDARTPAAYKQIWNTLGTIRGSEFPDELVLVGAHRDSWGPGAADNVSGTVSVLEAARAVAEQARAGNRPRRTIIFATWDAEEWGLIGSTEFVEEDSARLMRGAAAYFNMDVSATGPNFGGSASPSLRQMVRDVARTVPDPSGNGTVYEVWRRTAGLVADSLEPAMGDPGGGSDFAPFYNHLGIPHADWGFGGRYGVYHSHYDSFNWMTRFGDPDFRRHTAAAQIAATMVMRMANADVLPYDYAGFARQMRRYLPVLDSTFRARGYTALDTDALRGAIDRMERAGEGMARARDEVLATRLPNRRNLERANASLRRVERALTRPRGLRSRPWFRSLVYAADENNGYANVVFPSVQEAVRADDRRLAERELADLATRFLAATDALLNARDILTGDERR